MRSETGKFMCANRGSVKEVKYSFTGSGIELTSIQWGTARTSVREHVGQDKVR